MYKLLLILKYLRKRRIAWVSLLSVILCTAMVLVVVSVMGGWLRMFREQFHGLSGDVLVRAHSSLIGFPHYEEVMARSLQLPEVEAATPVIQTFGLVNISNQKPQGVQVIGYRIEEIGRVNKFPWSLWKQYNQLIEEADNPDNGLKSAEREALRRKAEEMAKRPSFALPLAPEVYRRSLPRAKGDVSQWPGMIAGTGVLDIRKNEKGQIEGRDEFLYSLPVRLTVLGMSPEGFSVDLGDKTERNYWIVDDSRTKVWQYDSNTVYVPFDVLQRDLGMEGDHNAVNADTGEIDPIPARTSEVHIKIKPDADPMAVRAKIERIVQEVLSDKQTLMVRPPVVQTWEQSQALWLGAIEKEVILVTGIVGFVSVVAVLLILCIFYMIVIEKTRDIGIIKSIGATNGGVATIFLGYGMAIGVVGSLLGFLVAYLIVRNINYLHTKLGELMEVQIWDPQVYAFETIPDTMNPSTVVWVIAIAIASCVVGAILPAVVAARRDPIESLRFE